MPYNAYKQPFDMKDFMACPDRVRNAFYSRINYTGQPSYRVDCEGFPQQLSEAEIAAAKRAQGPLCGPTWNAIRSEQKEKTPEDCEVTLEVDDFDADDSEYCPVILTSRAISICSETFDSEVEMPKPDVPLKRGKRVVRNQRPARLKTFLRMFGSAIRERPLSVRSTPDNLQPSGRDKKRGPRRVVKPEEPEQPNPYKEWQRRVEKKRIEVLRYSRKEANVDGMS